MFQNLLVPLDGSRMAESALAAAAYLAPRLRARVTLMHCIERAAPATVHGERHLREPEEARAYLEEAAARVFPLEVQVSCHTHAPEIADSSAPTVAAELRRAGAAGLRRAGVAPSILEHAKEMPSTLIVMCTHGRSGLGNLLFGSIAQRIVASGTTPVLLVPPAFADLSAVAQAKAEASAGKPDEGKQEFNCRRLLVPLDGDPAHEQALPVAGELAAACRSEIHLVFVVATRGSLPGNDAAVGLLLPRATRAVLEIARQEAEAYLARHIQCQQARQTEGGQAAGRTVTSEVCRGDVRKAIGRAAQRSRADLIVMATHRKEAMEAFWSGSVAARVASYAKRPLLLVPITE
ncbi:MAG: universal stress protein [Candidatus Brocadiia bacterium]